MPPPAPPALWKATGTVQAAALWAIQLLAASAVCSIAAQPEASTAGQEAYSPVNVD